MHVPQAFSPSLPPPPSHPPSPSLPPSSPFTHSLPLPLPLPPSLLIPPLLPSPLSPPPPLPPFSLSIPLSFSLSPSPSPSPSEDRLSPSLSSLLRAPAGPGGQGRAAFRIRAALPPGRRIETGEAPEKKRKASCDAKERMRKTGPRGAPTGSPEAGRRSHGRTRRAGAQPARLRATKAREDKSIRPPILAPPRSVPPSLAPSLPRSLPYPLSPSGLQQPAPGAAARPDSLVRKQIALALANAGVGTRAGRAAACPARASSGACADRTGASDCWTAGGASRRAGRRAGRGCLRWGDGGGNSDRRLGRGGPVN